MASALSTTTAATTFLQIVTACDKKYTERWRFNQHYMFMDDGIFYGLIQCDLVDKIYNVFETEDRKKFQRASVQGEKRNNVDSSPQEEEEGVTKKKTRRTSTAFIDVSTQTEDSMVMDLSSGSSVSLPLSTTTVVEAVDVYALVKKRRYQSSLLAQYKMYLCKSDLHLLDHHGLLDQLVELVEDVHCALNGTSWRSIHDQESTGEHEKHGVSIGVEEDSDDDEDDDYEFALTSEDDEDNDEQEQIEHKESSVMKKDLPRDKLVYIDAWTQTANDAAHICIIPV